MKKLVIQNFIVSVLIVLTVCIINAQTKESAEFKIADKTIAAIDNDDVIHPTFSPDSKRLAYSKMIVKDKQALTEIGVLDLQTKKTKNLLNSGQSEKYAVYAAFVYQMKWLDNNRLQALISDGDVDTTEVILDVAKAKIIKENYIEADYSPSTETQALQNRFVKAFPSVSESAAGSAFHGGIVEKLDDDRILLQFNHVDNDENIRVYNLRDKTVKVVYEMPPVKFRLNFIGGFTDGEDIVFAVNLEDGTKIIRYRNGKSEVLETLPRDENDYASFEKKYQSPGKTIFLLKTRGESEATSSSLWLYKNGVLQRVKDYAKMYDFEYNPATKRAAFCYWSDKERNIAVREVKF